ncbi:TniQ family protein [Thioclava sp. GXIMD4215]|uniref:TniQ family protein n=1 Tax=Thioclava sp. GXIMD4215 TaxID=3131928 RepID=UPI00311B0D1B
MTELSPRLRCLPITLPARMDEPAFSVLSRNAAVNASRTIAEFCTAMGLQKPAICAGDPAQITSLAGLIGADAGALIHASPQRESAKLTVLRGQPLLTRSIRKSDLAICPVCWLETAGNGSDAFPPLKWQWLPRFLTTCQTHGVALVEVPYADHTTCYDHILRLQLEPRWLYGLEDMIVQRKVSTFDAAAQAQLSGDGPMIPWLPEVQIDILKRWCLGLGGFMAGGMIRPDAAAEAQKRDYVDLGFAVTLAGKGRILDEVDAALGRHSMRLAKSWIHSWALQAIAAQERAPFRDIMLYLIGNQIHYGLAHRVRYASPDAQVEACIERLARRNDRSKKWVRKVLRQASMLKCS